MGRKRVVQVLESSLARATRGLAMAVEQDKPQLTAFNCRQLFYIHLHLGLIAWRSRESSAHQQLLEAVAVASRSNNLLVSAGLPFYRNFPVVVACGIASLLGAREFVASHAANLQEMVAERGSDAPEAGLALVLAGSTPVSNLLQLLETHPFPAEQRLWAESLNTYAGLLGGKPDASVERAESLYLRRKADPYLSGSIGIYGGGQDNFYVVDFWLGAVLHLLGYRGSSPHAWVGA